MNERIRELAEQAVYYDKDEESWEFDRKKFAELIIRECADIGERYADGNYEVRNQIIAQFGLEEPEE
jgi:hypothetical protein